MNTVCVDGKNISPSKIICVGRNYVEHIRELNNEIPDELLLFVKPNSAISTELTSFHQEALHYEAELSFLYEKGRFSAVGLGLDLTKRALQSELKAKGLPWERAKAFDGSGLFSSFVYIEKISSELNFKLTINGNLAQSGHIKLMMNSPERILTEISSFMRLEDGDIVMTGTPKGVGEIHLGDRFELTLFDEEVELTKAAWKAK
ncbi:fumarylacetoacetate hydrolase family protein [Shewanella woodyi]|uniref:fumarylacetoacetate hydrolase family protein n=1 Tax=Shewanella woodyi TaxID=60961 RepID=UPI0007EB7363|nr:fumarylacetoacetate hydrolase family protein [Shewanella woodyi]